MSYGFCDIEHFMRDFDIEPNVIRGIVDPLLTLFYNRPMLNIFKFDDYLHQRFGDYESNKKSMKDIFIELFGDRIEQAKYFFGIEEV